MSGIILLASNSRDTTCVLMKNALKKRGAKHDIIIYEADKAADGSVPLQITISQRSKLKFRYNNVDIDPPNVKAAWFRRPAGYEYNPADYRNSLERNQRAIQNVLWCEVPEGIWLNSLQRMFYAEQKLTQLKVARQIGFNIPSTVVANDWDPIKNALPKSVIFKLPTCQFENEKNKERMVINTKPYKNPHSLPTGSNPFPGLWQPYLSKRCEWRVVVVGQKVFSGAIYTKAKAKHDWRQYYFTDAVEVKDETFPEELATKCRRFLKIFKLRYGVFDFVESPDGKIHFLECNPNGQYGELENNLGMPITQAIADELLHIAQQA